MKQFGDAVILCGGKSSRMGFDKCKITFKDKYLIDIIGKNLEQIFDNIILASNDLEKFNSTKYVVINDMVSEAGPLGAIYTALKYSSSEFVFITACDMPVINIHYIKYMMKVIEDKKVDGVVSYNNQYIETLYAFYSKSMIPVIEKQLLKNNYKLLDIIKKCNFHYVEDSTVRKYSSNMEIFTNLNYCSDLSNLEKIFEGEAI